ncbi:hypothetical protein EPUS_01589 [Endocarpon pusillum Z07020]|uniref:TOG domain-containing protein n=1 Tax=Endocarpon pusillum (strain Z07020 / HMAS-L-300199) TaxID=1263415 RepID=U1I1H0_ENDPU|nr:uncharacterized protein EPUS_01589 [Endocarpon pusillum Z07020]ERF75759.1 hypothetical protein EPUS_01589 [Endocarpon pusillum Z07020]
MMTMKRSVQNPVVKSMPKPHTEPPPFAMLKDAGDAFVEHPTHIDTKLKDDENATKPLSITSARDFEDMSQDMHRLFEGKETEQNWDKRRKAIIKISRITHGNGIHDYRPQYITFIKSQLDNILKVVDSLRTNVSTAGLHTLQHIADALGHGVDFMVDFVAETLITRCCNTSKVKRDPAIATFETIISNATCNKNILHYIVSASEHKDPNARTAVAGWLIAIFAKNGRHCDHASVLDLIEKCIKNGLNDPKPQVRTPMRTTYATLDFKTQKMLDSNITVEPTKSSLKQQPSIKDIKAAKKKEMDAQESARPESAHSNRPSIKDIKAAKIREMKAKEVPRPPSAQGNKTFVRDARGSKRREAEVEDAARPPSAQASQPLIKDTKTVRKREAVVEDTARPSSAQSARSSTRDIKTTRKQDANAEDVIRPPPPQSNNATRKRDVEAQDTARPVSSQLYPSTYERKFHILSSAPMRPHRGLIELKRIPPKQAAFVQQKADAETMNILQTDDITMKKEGDKQVQDLENAALQPSSSRREVSQSETGTTKVPPFELGQDEQQIPVKEAAPLVATDKNSVRAGMRNRSTSTNVPPVHTEVDKRARKHGDLHKSGPPVSKHGRTHSGGSIQIHEDNASAGQVGTGKISQVTKRRSEERMKAGKEIVKEAPADHAGVEKISQVTKKRSEERMKARKEVEHSDLPGNRPPPSKHGRTRSTGSIQIHEDKASTGQAGAGKISQVTKRRSEERMKAGKEVVKVPSRRRSIRSPSPPTALREIDQLNQILEPIKKEENMRQKYISTEIAVRNRSISPNTKDPGKARTQLSNGIEKIRARKMDDYGYRRLQGLIKANDDLFQDEEKYDELLLALLDTLETPNTERRQSLGRQYDNKFQILVTIRLMLVHSAKYCAPYHARALSALLTARRNFESRCHIVGGLEETAEDIVDACSSTEVIDPVLDVLELQEHDDAGYRAISMGLHILSGLVARIKGTEILDKIQEERLTHFALKCLRNESSETRRATVAFCVELRRLINPEEKYFQMVAGNDEALKSLLTYFIATNRRR